MLKRYNKVSIIIPTYNRAEMLCKCVKSALGSDWPDIEVVVADDCSPDNTKELVERTFAGDERVKYVKTPRNGFTSLARNCGAKASSGCSSDFLFFIDDDNVLEPNAIGEMVATFERHPDAGFVSPLTVHWCDDGRRLVWTVGLDYGRWTTRFPARHRDNVTLDNMPSGNEFSTCASPNAMMTTRAVYERIGGFDESYGMQFDESDFCMRAIKATGEDGYICAKAVTRHFGFQDPAEVGILRGLGIGNPRRAYCFGRNRSKFARRHSGFPAWLWCVLVMAPASAIYYCHLAIKTHRPDIAWAYAKGTLRGMLGLQ